MPLSRPPARPPQILLDIDASMRSQNMGSAIGLARQAIDQGLRDPVLFNLRAFWHEQNGRLDPAVADLEAAHALAPDDANILNALGRCLVGLGRYRDAIRACTQAIAINPRTPATRYNRAFSWQLIGDLDNARREYRETIRLDPKHADAHAQLAGLAARRGNWEEARQRAFAALDLVPDHAVAVFALVMADIAERNFREAEGLLNALRGASKLVPRAEANALSLLGDLRDAEDRTAEAFAAYEMAGLKLREEAMPMFEGPRAEPGRAVLQRVAAAVEKASPLQPGTLPRSANDRSAGLVFLLGFPRSGTTLLGQILAAHPHIVTAEEQPFLVDPINELVFSPGALDRVFLLETSELERYRHSYWQRVRQGGFNSDGKIFVDQTPFNTIYLPILLTLFPEAKFIFALRDPRDVVFSCFRRFFTLNHFTAEFLTPGGAAAIYDNAMRLAEACRSKLEFRPLDIRNEDLVEDFDAQIGRLCQFIGVQWKDSLRSFAQSSGKRSIATPSAVQVRKGISAEGVGQWRRYRAQLEPILPILAPWVERFGYPPD